MATLKQEQGWVKKAWSKAPSQVDEKTELLYLMEEIGEMAEAVRKISGNKKNKRFCADLEKEFGDVLLSLMTLAIRYDIDLQKSFEKTKKSIKKRYIIGGGQYGI
jgi:NTP pyrophosphatase (non-canonical NTP hydrolase)